MNRGQSIERHACRSAPQAAIRVTVFILAGLLAGCGQPAADASGAATRAGLAPSAAPSASTPAAPAPTTPAALPRVRAVQLLTPTIGWALTDRELRLTTTGGDAWVTVTPPDVRADRLRGATFLDQLHGWAIVSDEPDAEQRTGLSVLRTVDGGRNWERALLAAPSGVHTDASAGPAALSFLDAQRGWAIVRLASSSNFSRGELFQTSDGGATWRTRTAPSGDPVRFITATDGWAAGGPGGGHLYASRDGGQSWQPQTVTLPEVFPTSRPGYALPTFFDSQHGVLPVTFAGDDTTPSGLGFYTTRDSGKSWTLALTIPEESKPGAGVSLSTQILSPTTWRVVHPGAKRVTTTRDGGRTAQAVTSTGLPASVAEITFVSDTVGWARAADAECPATATKSPGKNGCRATTVQLFGTKDDGQTWSPLTP